MVGNAFVHSLFAIQTSVCTKAVSCPKVSDFAAVAKDQESVEHQHAAGSPATAGHLASSLNLDSTPVAKQVVAMSRISSRESPILRPRPLLTSLAVLRTDSTRRRRVGRSSSKWGCSPSIRPPFSAASRTSSFAVIRAEHLSSRSPANADHGSGAFAFDATEQHSFTRSHKKSDSHVRPAAWPAIGDSPSAARLANRPPFGQCELSRIANFLFEFGVCLNSLRPGCRSWNVPPIAALRMSPFEWRKGCIRRAACDSSGPGRKSNEIPAPHSSIGPRVKMPYTTGSPAPNMQLRDLGRGRVGAWPKGERAGPAKAIESTGIPIQCGETNREHTPGTTRGLAPSAWLTRAVGPSCCWCRLQLWELDSTRPSPVNTIVSIGSACTRPGVVLSRGNEVRLPPWQNLAATYHGRARLMQAANEAPRSSSRLVFALHRAGVRSQCISQAFEHRNILYARCTSSC